MTVLSKPFNTDNAIEVKRLEMALDAACIGTWDFDPDKKTFRFCERFKAIFDYSFEDAVEVDTILSRIHTDDRDLVLGSVKSALDSATDGQFDVEFRTFNRKDEIRWVNLKGQALRNDVDKVFLLSGIALNITANALIKQRLTLNEERFRSLIEEASMATCLFVGPEMRIEIANDIMIGYWGKDKSILGKPLLDAIPELRGQAFPKILDDIYKSGEIFTATNMSALLEVDGVLKEYFYDFTYKPLRNEKGEIYAIMDTAIDVTDKVVALKSLESSEAKLRSVIATAPAAIGLFVSRDLVIEMPNQAFIDIVGKGPDIVGKPLREVMPELESQAYLQILDDVFTSGKMYQSFGTQVDIVQHGIMSHNFYNITYTPLLDASGEVYAILDIAIDVTERMEAEQQIEQSQQQLLALFEQSPVGIAIIDKNNLVFTMANRFYSELVGKQPEEIIGKSLLEAIPELTGQGFDDLLNHVVKTETSVKFTELPITILRNSVQEKIYIDFVYQPKRDIDNVVSGILVVVTDMTEQVLARQKIQEAEIGLRGAVELANLGTWQIDLNTRILDYSPRLRQWFGIGEDEIVTVERAYEPIRESDRPLIKAAINKAIAPDSDGIYDVEYVIEAEKTGRQRILHAQGKTYFNENGDPVRITGSAQDVTEQRQVQLALEELVRERTEELEIKNEELAKSNILLTHSNENLQQFAYVASHDLQEPLRKIQSFGDLLKKRFANDLGAGAEYLDRMQGAAKRMSFLIEDLLAFSRVSTQRDTTSQVSLNKTVKSVLNDLELVIHETGAQIHIGELPTIPGDVLQLGQLFQNLISNAIKFHKPGTAPVVKITSEIVKAQDWPLTSRPLKMAAAYYRINIIDQGIGFDSKYTDRIFQIFQRLHGKTEYAGTGIGLAICEKVVTNHGGVISANSELGVGSVFSVFLPA
ncbi:PAS domain-containing protein [Dyadobacter sp. CY345]|uniref:PAS domain-containing protein n=1 Tax=Dyadobacter sp. CY345 TaxID=2909335 RepID=UPI001F180216|nr:PAS domain-containing protein [Dyadobacter sp. CY345]MCF2447224.1 PAS domain-containing protein [Dyadobacter sp. CY345]